MMACDEDNQSDPQADGETSTGGEAQIPWSQQNFSGGFSPTAAAATMSSQHSKLREYETRRRLAYTSKFDSISLYWKSYRDLLTASIQETGRAQRLVLGTSRAHQLYANAMKAMHEDVFLDEKGNITTEKQQKRLAPSRIKVVQSITGTWSRPKEKPSVLKEVREAQKVVGDKFEENAKNMAEEIAEAVALIHEDIKVQFTAMEQLGSAILNELEKTEQEVSQAWNTYFPTASTPSTMTVQSPKEAAPKNGEETDSWLLEMQYRVAVAYQNTAWEKASAELANLFERVKQEECARRMSLREFLVAFVQRQQRLYLSLPSVQNSVLEELVSKEMSKQEIDDNIEVTIQAAVRKHEHTSGKKASPFGEPPPKEQLEIRLESPIKSDLLSKAKIVERTSTGTNAGWRTSLAVMTADSFLHFFDLTSESSLSTETALNSLIPRTIVPTSENLHSGNSNFFKGWSDSICPTESLVLANCSIQHRDATSFELTERVTTSGATKMLRKKATKRVLINTPTNVETNDWIAILTAQI